MARSSRRAPHDFGAEPKRNDEKGFFTPFKMKLAGIFAAAATVIGGIGYAGADRVTDREAAVKVVRGKVVDPDVESGVKLSSWLPQTEFIKYPLYLQKVPVSATAEDDVTIRTAEKARIYGTFEVHYVLDRDNDNFGNLYTELNADDIADLEPFIRNYTIPAAIEVYKDVPTTELNDQLTDSLDEQGNVVKGIGTKLKERLQEILNSHGYNYIQVKDVIPSGVGLSEKANHDLEQIVSEERKLELLEIQGQVADKSVEITEKQAAVTAKALEALREAGVPEGDLIKAYYLQLLRDNDAIGEQFVPGPIPGTGVGAVPIQQPDGPN